MVISNIGSKRSSEAEVDALSRARAGERRIRPHETRAEIARVLADPRVPGKDDVLKMKRLIRALVKCDEAGFGEDAGRRFVSAYLDLQLGRIGGEPGVEKDAMRRCLSELLDPADEAEITAGVPSGRKVRAPGGLGGG